MRFFVTIVFAVLTYLDWAMVSATDASSIRPIKETTPVTGFDLRTVEMEAENGNALAQSRLGFTYSTGNVDVPRDRRLAVRWWQRATEQNQPFALHALGNEYWMGDKEADIQQDQKLAVTLWHRSGTDAEVDLANAYRMGKYEPINDDEKARLLELIELRSVERSEVSNVRAAAASGDAVAQSRLGFAYASGQGGLKQNLELAKVWWQQAAERGRRVAQRALGNACHNGQGTPKDERAAAKWWHLAAMQGDSESRTNLAFAYRDGLYLPIDLAEQKMLSSELKNQEAIQQQFNQCGWNSGVAR
jgi:TPR repeat protein